MHEFLAGNKDVVTASSEGRVAAETDDARKYASNDRVHETDGKDRPLHNGAAGSGAAAAADDVVDGCRHASLADGDAGDRRWRGTEEKYDEKDRNAEVLGERRR